MASTLGAGPALITDHFRDSHDKAEATIPIDRASSPEEPSPEDKPIGGLLGNVKTW
jgi:hypothetical protein